MGRQRPRGTALSKPFWDAASRGELLGCECDRCAGRFFNPEPMCPACGSTEWHWVESRGEGTVYSFTVVHQSPDVRRPAPYVLAIVDLDDGWTMLTNVVGPAERVAIDARVRVSFTPAAGPETALIPMFALLGDGPCGTKDTTE
jgi:uncharacterized OB-fold protein